MDVSTLCDPLSMNLRKRWDAILPFIHTLPSQPAESTEELVETLACLLYDARYTLLIAQKYRPILFIICAWWLDHHGHEDAKFAALALLVQLHEELFPILSTFIRTSHFSRGPLEQVSGSTSMSQLHLRLLAYYRILIACPHAPAQFQWPPEPLLQLLSMPSLDNGTRWLIVRCHALHTRMSEAQRDGLEMSILGPPGGIDVPIEAGISLEGETQWIDGWLLPVLEILRVREFREAMLDDHDFYDVNNVNNSMLSLRLDLDKLTHRVADVHGILLLKASSSVLSPFRLISTASTVKTLRALAIHLSLRLPTLISSPPSSGKSVILNHLASLLYPASPHQLVTIYLSDTSLDARSLLGSYVSSTQKPGTFEWKEGVIVRAMRHGRWLVLEDIDRASSEVLGTLIPLIESLAAHKHIGAPALLDVPGHGRVEASENFAIFATRSVPTNANEKLPAPTFLGFNKWSRVDVPVPTKDELVIIISGKFSRLGQRGTRAVVHAWMDARALGPAPGVREIGIHELETWCRRLESLLPSDTDVDMDVDEETSLELLYPHVGVREEMYLDARDVFFGAGAFSESARIHIAGVARVYAHHLGLSPERAQWVINNRLPELQIERDGDGHTTALRIGKTRLLAARSNTDFLDAPQRPFAMHRPALLITERLSTCISLSEPVLLVGETGTGKTTLVSHIASRLHRQLVSLNLSHQTESSDLLGGFKPVDTRVPAGELQRQFLALFTRTFSRRKNSKFEDAVRKAINEGKWKRAVGLWKECTRLALDKIKERAADTTTDSSQIHGEMLRTDVAFNGDTPRKRRRVEQQPGDIHEAEWLSFARAVEVFDVQHVHGQGKFAFGFVEGPLVQALRSGHWVLLDEINLASPETLECISSILQGPTASIVLTEQGSFVPIPRHPDFRLFACMNPATDVGKKDLSPNIRSRFTEIHVPPPDTDRETLLAIVQQYIGHCALADKSAVLDVAEFYMEVKKLAERRELADGSNHRPHFSMRTLARALTFTSDVVLAFGLRRALWEGCLMAFSMALDEKSITLVKRLAEKHVLSGVKNVRAMMAQIPAVPPGGQAEQFERIGPFWLERGILEPDPVSEYILTPSVQSKLMDLARVVLTRRFPVLIEGPTSSGKTSAVEYLARRTGHRFVRVNNHEHTDIQEYLGTYVSDPDTGKLIFQDGILVRALRNGDWIVLDELNLAPTDVLEALNRLLDDNRELIVPETHEVVRPHPHFMLFATQNPPGLYAGRKVLSRAFRNRFLEVHFDDVPQSELQTILSERCRIPESYAHRIATVFQELSKRRQAGRVFETKHGFATLRDLFRWAGREASSTQELAQNGYMLLAERARRPDDKEVVKEVIENVLKERIDPDALYDLQDPVVDLKNLGISLPTSSNVVWTSAMRRLFKLVAHALQHNEPVLLVGETGSGKTSVCQLYANAVSKHLTTVNCHQSTETADLIGSQRPLRNRLSSQVELIRQTQETLQAIPELIDIDEVQDVDGLLALLKKAVKVPTLSPASVTSLHTLQLALQQSQALFEWHDGPLICAMRMGDVFLLDEISLADDSVLERLNSVLEPARTIVLAERGGFDVDHAQVTAHAEFKLLATMNPGGDYGKKELSPALRNRFTEIWVPPVELKSDLRMLIEKSWCHESLLMFTDHILTFTEWLASAVGVASITSLRDLLAWVNFSNRVFDSQASLSASIIFHHAAHMVFLDGLESAPCTSSWPTKAVNDLRERACVRLEQLVPLGEYRAQAFDSTIKSTPNDVAVGPFVISKGPLDTMASTFSLQAPTTLDNIRRLVRACQLSKPILLEGSPGVGKTSLVAALGDIAGHRVCRINLSDQTDLVDLFGSDFPVEGGRAGEFTWKDAAFLRAMQDGDWVLLDEMNLAPQTVLEGLNAVLDHRGTVFIPELGRSFTKHPRFRIFAAQNPLHQGGGRKGLPRSFLDRFTKVYIRALTSDDLILICQNLFPTLSVDHLRSMIVFNSRLHEEIVIKRSFGRDGGPWEFNLRDIIRWATLLVESSELLSTSHPSDHLDTLYLQRFSTEADRIQATDIFCQVFNLPPTADFSHNTVWTSTTRHHAQFGSALLARGDHHPLGNSVELQRHLRPLATASVGIQKGWLLILSGNAGTGKTQLVRYLASKTGRRLHEFPMSSGVDTADILGSFEQLPNPSEDVSRFEWIDGPLIRAMKEGHWIVLDNANLCSPSVLDRLNSLCETNGFLVLTERGHVNGEVEILKPDPRFRLILTVDPRNGDLSRAMRNRAIETHLLTASLAIQDHIRLLDAIRVPSRLWSVDDKQDDHALRFDLIRRATSHFPRSHAVPLAAVRNGLLNHDFVASSMLDCATIQQAQCFEDSPAGTYAHTLFAIRMLAPSMISVFRRLRAMLEGLCLKSDTKVCLPRALFDELDHHRIWTLRDVVGQTFTQTRGVPSSFISAQPFDLFMNPKLSVGDEQSDGLIIQQRVLSVAIELFVHVHFSDHSRTPPGSAKLSIFDQSRLCHNDPGRNQDILPGVLSIYPIYASIMTSARTILQALSLDRSEEQLILLERTRDLIDFVEHLRKSASGSHFDFTSARVISTWLHNTLATDTTLLASYVGSHAECLAGEVSLASGHGMQEIWRDLLLPETPEVIRVALARLDHLLVCQDPNSSSYGTLRAEAFNIMSLLTLNLPCVLTEQDSIMTLCGDLEQRIASNDVLSKGDCTPQYTPQLAIAELEFLWRAISNETDAVVRQRGEFLIKLASQTACTSLVRLSRVQHHLWALDARTNQSVLRLATLASMLREWMSALNDISIQQSPATPRSPDTILKPFLLNGVLEICLHDQALYTLDSHEDALRLQGMLAVNQCQDKILDRLDQILCVWIGVLVILGTCFKETYTSDTWKKLTNAASHGQCRGLAKLLASSTNTHLSLIVSDHLIPLSHGLDGPHQTETGRVSALGKAWVHLGLALLKIYVPNIPLDPVAAQNCIFKFWLNREAEVLAQIDIYESGEKMTTGNNNISIVCMLQIRLNEIRSKLKEIGNTLTTRDVDVGSLYALFGEITPFLTQVVYSAKFNALISDLEAARAGSQSRALTVQANISGFMTRLDCGYAQFTDIIQPISLALSILRFGLHLLVHGAQARSANVQLVGRLRTLVEFPTVAAIEVVKPTVTSDTASSQQQLLSLVSLAYNIGLGSVHPGIFNCLDNIYRQLAESWLEDLHDQEREVQESQSLYRHKSMDYHTQSDAELDETEFLAMFPTFEDTDPTEQRNEKPTLQTHKAPSIVPRLSASDKERIYRLHLWVIHERHSEGRLGWLDDEYHELRTISVRKILATHITELPQGLDTESLPYQILLLSKGIKQLRGDRLVQRGTYSFYHDPNIPEVRKALSVVRTIQQRLVQLIKDWPDQMVLHHLLTRCEAVLQLNLRSPVAKVLSTLEQLILQTEDWEIYSNRENSLKPQQAALSELIVNWRRLELSCWSHLLEAQYLAFSAGTAEWWFRLYELTIRGTLAAAGDGCSTDAYFAEMIPLVEQFVTTGPIGQFAARVQLLNSFGVYSDMLSHIRHGSDSEALARASRILQRLHNFYEQFGHTVSHSLAERRAKLEKELLDYIKLASWKDVNVYALKQSAQRTHRQLFKCVRKFRELLREAVAPILSDKTSDTTNKTSALSSWSKPVFTCQDPASPIVFPSAVPSDGLPQHMLDLSGTLVKFEHLLKSHGELLINSVSCEGIDEFAGHISETVAALSADTNVAGSNMQLHKTLMMRKRKAWIDLLQELKRAGFSSRLKPDILDRQQDKVWLLDRSPVTVAQDSPFHYALKGEDYLNRMLLSLPELRRSLSTHHGDLTTRELQRGATYVESSLALALSARDRFTRDYVGYLGLDRTAQRLRSLLGTRGTIVGAPDVSPWLELCCKVKHALEEISSGCLQFNTLGDALPLSREVLTAISTHLDAILQSHQTLITLQDRFRSTHTGLMTTEERDDFYVARTRIVSTTAALTHWKDNEPRIRHLCNPVLAWLSRIVPVAETSPSEVPGSEAMPHRIIIERLLLIVQSLLSLRHTSQPDELDQPPDNYASECESLSGNMSRVFAIGSVAQAMDSFVDDLAVSPMAGRPETIQMIIPFVDAYLRLVKNHLLVQAQLVKSLFKLSYILCRVVLSLAEKGFCKPSEMEESPGQTGEGEGIQDGTGLGQGTGASNVSNQIEDESQVEGLRNEETTPDQPDQPEDATDGDGIEMGEDFGGDTHDLDGDENETGSVDGSQPEANDEVGEVDAADPGAVDEKLWGNENIQGENAEGQSSKDASMEQNPESEVVAKENQEQRQTSKPDNADPPLMDQVEEDHAELNDEEMGKEHPVDAGKQMDDFVPEADTLDLPDDLNLGTAEDEQEENPDNQGNAMEEEPQEDFQDTRDHEPTLKEAPAPQPQETYDADHDDNAEGDMQETPVPDIDKQPETALAQLDLSEGNTDSQMKGSNVEDMHDSPSGDQPEEASDRVQTGSGVISSEEKKETDEGLANGETSMAATANEEETNDQDIGSGAPTEPAAGSSSLPNPLRSLGDTLKEIRRRWDQIRDASESEPSSSNKFEGVAPPQEVEYLHEGMDEDHDLQALGPAKEDQVAKLSDLHISEEEHQSDLINPLDDHDPVMETQESHAIDNLFPTMHMNASTNTTSKDRVVEDALTYDQIKVDYPSQEQLNEQPRVESLTAADVNVTASDDDVPDEQSIEVAVKKWQEEGHSDTSAGEMWRLYDSLTQELSFALCEQLRLILEPTLATRLRGDYRTGKRLNMKKIIPYIASEYTKDKIWLRRTRPSQREYQVLIALDDSRSMAESRSIHLAYETLALVSKALNRLESGEVAIARFGESIELVHGFEDGMVGEREGEKLMRQFKFQQRKTDVLGLVEASLKVLTQARERRSMGRTSSEAADLWQLEIIISDGICQDHDKLRTVLRRAEEQRVMIVFVVIDSLHTHHDPSSNTTNVTQAHQSSILAMNQVSYKDVGGGRMELQLDRYLDSFPFQYYVVLRSVEALPDVLSGTLKQFFERISEE